MLHELICLNLIGFKGDDATDSNVRNILKQKETDFKEEIFKKCAILSENVSTPFHSFIHSIIIHSLFIYSSFSYFILYSTSLLAFSKILYI